MDIVNIDNRKVKLHIHTHKELYGFIPLPSIWWHVRNGCGSQIVDFSWLRWHLTIDFVKWIQPEHEENNGNKN